MEEQIKFRKLGKSGIEASVVGLGTFAIGCSNVTPDQMDEYSSAGRLDVDQDVFSMLVRKHGQDNLPYCEEHGISYLAYAPLCQGLLTGKIGAERTFREGDFRKGKPRFSVENRQKISAMLNTFRPIAERHKISLGQLALAWTVAQPGCSHALAGARTAEQATENAVAGAIELSAEELQIMQQTIEQHVDEIL